ncbi:hypothetical protein PF006_g33280 [Phytophthora fragariae]|uniref:Uncharacterized protein n=1 Tax=Phytophthora fragariae TaxID=53985 RepID=A0A6A3P6Q3_9STRA|nr:hypothetical protein PF006_g33280 [Phytophthora fragariae]
MLAYPFSALSARSSKGSGAALGDATSGVCVDGRGDMSTRSVAIPVAGEMQNETLPVAPFGRSSRRLTGQTTVVD